MVEPVSSFRRRAGRSGRPFDCGAERRGDAAWRPLRWVSRPARGPSANSLVARGARAGAGHQLARTRVLGIHALVRTSRTSRRLFGYDRARSLALVAGGPAAGLVDGPARHRPSRKASREPESAADPRGGYARARRPLGAAFSGLQECVRTSWGTLGRGVRGPG